MLKPRSRRVCTSLPSRVFLAGNYTTRVFCGINTSIVQSFVHGSQYDVPFVLTVFSMSPPLTHGTEYVV